MKKLLYRICSQLWGMQVKPTPPLSGAEQLLLPPVHPAPSAPPVPVTFPLQLKSSHVGNLRAEEGSPSQSPLPIKQFSEKELIFQEGERKGQA